MRITAGPDSANRGVWWNDLRPVKGLDHLVIDLSQVQFVGPAFMVRLRALLDWFDAELTSVDVIPPNEQVAGYLSRMHVGVDLGPCINFPLPEVNEHDQRTRLIPVTHSAATPEYAFDDLLGDLLDAPEMAGAGYLGSVVERAAQELLSNAVEHGANPIGAYVAAQRFAHRTGDPHRCVVAIGDLGIGMAAHLRRGGLGLQTDCATIQNGLADMVTGTGERSRGRGYATTFTEARKKGSGSAIVKIRANGGRVHAGFRGRQEIADVRDCDDVGPGTWVEFTFSHAGT